MTTREATRRGVGSGNAVLRSPRARHYFNVRPCQDRFSCRVNKVGARACFDDCPGASAMSTPRIDDPRAVAKVVRDPVHNYVTIRAELLPLVNHPFVQRLRRISQTSFSSVVYPAMTGRRFEHSLGAMHLAARAWRTAWANSTNRTRNEFRRDVREFLKPFANDHTTVGGQHLRTIASDQSTDEEFASSLELGIAAAALLHDVGHPPYSHALEAWYEYNFEWIVSELDRTSRDELVAFRDSLTGREIHEVIGLLLVEHIEESVRAYLPWEVVSAILWDGVKVRADADTADRDKPGMRTWVSCLHELIAGEVDVDRLDYLVRDARNSGTEFGSFDIERLLQSVELHKLDAPAGDEEGKDPWPTEGWHVGFGVRATSALESFVNQRFQYYRWVVYHHHVIAANRMLNLCLHYLQRASGIIDIEGRLDSSKGGGKKFNYFGLSSGIQATVKRNRSVAHTDDGTVLEWIKDGLADHRYESDDRDAADQPITRFVALADAVLHRAPNWVPVWKTDGDYHTLSETLFKPLKMAFNNARLKFDLWKSKNDGELVQIAERRFSAIAQLIEPLQFPADLPVPRTSVPYVPGGAVPFMNKIAEVLLSTDEALGNFRFRRELEAAGLFGTIAGEIEGQDNGFWVFAFNRVVPWKLGDGAAKVFKGRRFVPLSEESGYALHWLEGAEAERAQFHAYFVSPNRNSFTADEMLNIRETFRRTYPKFIYNAMLQTFQIPG